MSTNIVEWAESKYGFYVDRRWVDGQWVLRPGPIRLADYHRDILRHIFTPDDTGKLPYDVVAWCEPAKGGKSALAGLVAEYMALHGEQNSTIVMASNKQQQAQSIMFKSLVDSVEYNPHLPNVEPARLSVTFTNGNEVKAIASNSRGEAGARFSLALFDELWGYIYEDAKRLWTEFKTDPTRTSSVKMAVGYGGYIGEGELWQSLLETGIKGEVIPELAHIKNADGSPCCFRSDRQFTFWSHVCRQPWQTQEWIESQHKALRPAEFIRMIQCNFVEGAGDFCEPSDWEALIDPRHKPLEPFSDKIVSLGLDLATSPKGDDCALVGVYADGPFVKVAFHKVWKGKERKARLKLSETVLPYIIRQKGRYNIRSCYFDPYQALQLAEMLRIYHIRCIEVSQTHATRGPKDTALLEMVNNRQLVLYDEPDLRSATAGASVKELGNGLVFLKKAGGRSKIDLLVALSNVADEARRPRGTFII